MDFKTLKTLNLAPYPSKNSVEYYITRNKLVNLFYNWDITHKQNNKDGDFETFNKINNYLTSKNFDTHIDYTNFKLKKSNFKPLYQIQDVEFSFGTISYHDTPYTSFEENKKQVKENIFCKIFDFITGKKDKQFRDFYTKLMDLFIFNQAHNYHHYSLSPKKLIIGTRFEFVDYSPYINLSRMNEIFTSSQTMYEAKDLSKEDDSFWTFQHPYKFKEVFEILMGAKSETFDSQANILYEKFLNTVQDNFVNITPTPLKNIFLLHFKDLPEQEFKKIIAEQENDLKMSWENNKLVKLTINPLVSYSVAQMFKKRSNLAPFYDSYVFGMFLLYWWIGDKYLNSTIFGQKTYETWFKHFYKLAQDKKINSTIDENTIKLVPKRYRKIIQELTNIDIYKIPIDWEYIKKQLKG